MPEEKMCPLFTIAKVALNTSRELRAVFKMAPCIKDKCGCWHKGKCSFVGIVCALEDLTAAAIDHNTTLIE